MQRPRSSPGDCSRTHSGIPLSWIGESLVLRGGGDGELALDALRLELDLIAGPQSVEGHSFHHIAGYMKSINLVRCNQSQMRDRPVSDCDRTRWPINLYDLPGDKAVTFGGHGKK